MALTKPERPRTRILVVAALGAVLAVVTGVVVASARSGHASSPQAQVATCSGRAFPSLDGEVDTNLDVERSLLSVSAYNSELGRDETFTVRYDDPTCLAVPRLARVIGHALATERDARAGTCASVRELVRANATESRGRPVDLAAARRYLGAWC